MTVRTTTHRWMRVGITKALSGLVAAIATASGCGLEPSDPELTSDRHAVKGSTWMAEYSDPDAPNMAGVSVAELSVGIADYSQSGLRMIRFEPPPGAPSGVVDFRVLGHDLVGRDASGAVVLSGAQMVGAKLAFEHHSEPGIWTVQVAAYQQRVSHWVEPTDPLPTYRLVWTGPGASPSKPPANLCGNPPPMSDDPLSAAWLGAESDILLFTGERYDIDSGAVLATGADADGWINLACARTPRANMILYRHDPTTPAGAGFATTADQRETLLRMFRADYWGNGTSHSRPGEPLVWEDSQGWITSEDPTAFPAGRGSIEAIWTRSGVLCLDTPRRLREEGDAIWAAIESSSPDGTLPPRCAGIIEYDTGEGIEQLNLEDWHSFSHLAHLVSWNPEGE
ncbi:MAG: ADYC domain-containing protein [Myxococcota bacterium]